MALNVTLTASSRTGTLGEIRQQGFVPAVLYGHGITNQSLAINRKTFTHIFKQSGHTSLVTLSLADGEEGAAEHPVLIREVQLHPVRGDILHVDLYQVRMDEAIRAQVPLSFVGISPAVKDQGGILVRNMDEVELEALPADLPHSIEVDITGLTAFDQPIRVKDLTISKKVTLLAQADEVVAIVQAPRSEEELEAELAEEVTEDVKSVEGVADKPAEDAAPEGEAEPKEAKEAKETSKEN